MYRLFLSAFSKYIPSIRFGSTIKQNQGQTIFQRYGHLVLLGEMEQKILQLSDGNRSVQEICQLIGPDNLRVQEDGYGFMRKMGRLGHIVFATTN